MIEHTKHRLDQLRTAAQAIIAGDADAILGAEDVMLALREIDRLTEAVGCWILDDETNERRPLHVDDLSDSWWHGRNRALAIAIEQLQTLLTDGEETAAQIAIANAARRPRDD